MFVVLDCGHAKNTAGKYSPKLDDGSRFYEYKYNRILGQMIGNRLTELGIDWCFTYDIEDEKDLSLTARANVANQKAKLYGYRNVLLISIHYNALGCGEEWYDAKGLCVFTTNGETISDRYANALIKCAKEVLEPLGREVRTHYEKNFTVIYKTVCPSILIEYGFFTNKEEVEWLMSEEGLKANCELTIKMIEKMI
jgi:N-acetylmuramoyl-L-alanine amidase